MPDIKTRNIVKSTIKTIDKSAVAAERVKDAYIRTKDKAEHSVYSAEGSPGEYAADRVSGGTDTVTREAIHQFDKQGRKSVKTTKENISKVKEHFNQRPTELAKKQVQKELPKDSTVQPIPLKNPLKRLSVTVRRLSRRQNPRARQR